MFNILANTFFIASRNPQHHKTDFIRFKQRQMDSTSEDLFQKDLYKSTLTGFYLKMLWKKYDQRRVHNSVELICTAPRPPKTPSTHC